MHDRTTHLSRFLLPLLVGGLVGLASPAWGQIHENLKLLPVDGAAENEFGYSIAIDNGIVAVGARNDGDNGTASGSAYLLDASTGMQIVKILPDDGAPGDEFGFSIAMSNGIVAVGSRWADDNGANSGSAYLFDASTGTQMVKLLPGDGAAGDEFGFAIAVDGGIVAVGAKRDDDNGPDSGSVYLFDASTGTQLAKLLPGDGAANDNFGESVALDNGIVAVGAHGNDDNGPLSGAAYLFDVSTQTEIAKLLADDGATNDFFGSSIAIDRGMVAVGAWAKSVVFDHSGAAYVFDAFSGMQIAKLLPDDGADRDNFGISVAIDNGIVAVGARNDDDNGFNSGSAYAFDASSGSQIGKYLASDGVVFDLFGSSVAIDNGVLAVGATGDEDNGPDSGSAYVFDAPATESCLSLRVDNFVAGERAVFTITGGTPGAKAVTAYGTQAGETSVDDVGGFCATFGIMGVNRHRVAGGLNRFFDGNGEITFGVNLPEGSSGLRVLLQSTERGTCPDECMSNLLDMIVD